MDVPKRQPSGETSTPRRPWAIALDVASECLLYIFLNYMVSCVNLSFWNHPIRILTFALNLVVLGKLLASLDRVCPKKWMKWVAFVGSVALVVLLVAVIGYFPVGETPVRLPWN